jgi:excisionase family DNA binding protein
MPADPPALSVLEMLERDEAYMATIKAIGTAAPLWLSVKKTADYLGRSVRQIRRYEAEGKMPSRKKFGREWRYPRSELEKIKSELDHHGPTGRGV